MSASPYIDYRQFFGSRRNQELVEQSTWRQAVCCLVKPSALAGLHQPCWKEQDCHPARRFQQELQQHSQSLKTWLQRKRYPTHRPAGGER